MSDRPPPPAPNEDLDVVIRRMDRNLTSVLKQGQQNALGIAALEGRVVKVEGSIVAVLERVSVIEDEVRGGVHRAPASATSDVDTIPVHVEPLEEGKPEQLSPPPPPMRAPMSTHEELARLNDETKAQTPLLKKVAESQSKAANTQRNMIAAFVGTVFAVMLSQCQPATVQAWIHAFQDKPRAPAATPAPAPSR